VRVRNAINVALVRPPLRFSTLSESATRQRATPLLTYELFD
jgi:hypothetical protein